MAACILDASVVLALLFAEEGGDIVLPLLPEAIVSVVNDAEVRSRMIRAGVSGKDVDAILSSLPIEVLGADAHQARRAGALVADTQAFGLSLGDRFCLALAEQRGLPVYTADRAWSGLDIGIDIRMIR